MSIIKDILVELFSMFVSDAWLTAGILFVVAIAAIFTEYLKLDPLVGGGVLLGGCLLLVLMSVSRTARLKRR